MSPTYKCEGCGSVDPGDVTEQFDDVKHHPTARLCRGRYNEPKNACLGKYLLGRPNTCALCGTQESLYTKGFKLRPVCEQCFVDLEELKEHKKKDRHWYYIKSYSVFGDALPARSHVGYDVLTNAFKRVLNGDAHRSFVDDAKPLFARQNSYDSPNTGDIWSMLTEAQAQGVKELVEEFKKVIDGVAEHSKQEGGALLVKLARGEVSVEEFEDGRAPARKKEKKR